ncbi:MAG: biotin--[acetyl-CoA-carboxylase] ligase [Oscillospiraceae bacterium]|nr:biotin--[acetyl-CoA-carboxylase] ligase [Oscillospiraceae bacterium]
MNTKIIKTLLKNENLRILALDETGSTNIAAKENAAAYDIFFAEKQTAGRGRFERRFYSPPETGIYMSVILRDVQNTTLITPAAAVAVCRAVERLTGKKAQIKWVNDILLGGRKICGILAESAQDYVIVGIGINFTTDFSDFPDLNAAAVFERNEKPTCMREELAAGVINEFYGLCRDLSPSFMDEYRALSCLMGLNISYMQNNEKFFGTVTGIDDSGRLLVKDGEGRINALSSGEVMLVREE